MALDQKCMCAIDCAGLLGIARPFGKRVILVLCQEAWVHVSHNIRNLCQFGILGQQIRSKDFINTVRSITLSGWQKLLVIWSYGSIFSFADSWFHPWLLQILTTVSLFYFWLLLDLKQKCDWIQSMVMNTKENNLDPCSLWIIKKTGASSIICFCQDKIKQKPVSWSHYVIEPFREGLPYR